MVPTLPTTYKAKTYLRKLASSKLVEPSSYGTTDSNRLRRGEERTTSMRNLREAKMVFDSFLPDEIEAGKN